MKNKKPTQLTLLTKITTRHPKNIHPKTDHIPAQKKIQKTTFFYPKKRQKNRFQQPTNPVKHLLQTNNTKKIQKCCKTTQFCIFFRGGHPMKSQDKHKQFTVKSYAQFMTHKQVATYVNLTITILKRSSKQQITPEI